MSVGTQHPLVTKGLQLGQSAQVWTVSRRQRRRQGHLQGALHVLRNVREAQLRLAVLMALRPAPLLA